MSIRLGRWDCPVCGQVGNLGNATSCPSCGSPRGKDVQFYLPENSDEITEAKLLQEANAGVDWRCDYCGSDNKATATTCKSCGNERTKEDIDRNLYEYSLSETPHANPSKKVKPDIAPESLTQKSPGFKSKGLLFVIGLVLVIAIISFMPRSFKVQVIKHSWYRSIEIENNKLVTEEDWNMPSNAVELKNSSRAIHHYNQVLSHYETRYRNVQVQVGSEQYICGQTDMGNGYFQDRYCDRPVYDTRQESYQAPIYTNVPVYATKYRYTIYKWVKDHDIDAQGNDQNAKWPSEQLANNNWREGKKTEKYILFLKDNKGKEYQEEVDYNLWSNIRLNQQIYAKKNSVGGFYGIDRQKLLN